MIEEYEFFDDQVIDAERAVVRGKLCVLLNIKSDKLLQPISIALPTKDIGMMAHTVSQTAGTLKVQEQQK